MKTQLKPTFALAGVSCAVFGLALSGCNQGGGATGIAGAAGGSPNDTLATVGTSKVTRANLNTFLEAQGGERALPLLIDNQLILEALKAKSGDVTEAEIDADLVRRQLNDPQIADLIKAGGPQLPLIRLQVKREIAIQKLLTDGIKATDAQLKSFFEKNRSYYDQPAQTKVGMLLASTKVRADLMAGQLKSKSKTLVQLVAEQKKAADPVAGNSSEDPAALPIWPQISPRILPLTTKLSKGGVTAVQQFAPQAFGVFQVTDKTAPVKADFAKVRAEVEANYKAAEVAKKTVAKNPQNPAFDETIKRTVEALRLGDGSAPGNPKATLRDALNFINQYAANELISGLRTGGTVQIEDAGYAKVAAPYQAVGAAAGNSASGNAASGNAATGNSASGNAAPVAAANAAP